MRRLTRRQQLSAVVLAVLALLFISLDFAGGSLGGARGGATGALGSLYRGTDVVLGPARRFVQGVPDVGGNRREIAQLKQRNNQLQAQLAAGAADAATAKKLAALQLQADSERWQVMPVSEKRSARICRRFLSAIRPVIPLSKLFSTIRAFMRWNAIALAIGCGVGAATR